MIKTFSKQCGAIAEGRGAYGWGIADNVDSAIDLALESCKSNKGKKCSIVVWACDDV